MVATFSSDFEAEEVIIFEGRIGGPLFFVEESGRRQLWSLVFKRMFIVCVLVFSAGFLVNTEVKNVFFYEQTQRSQAGTEKT